MTFAPPRPTASPRRTLSASLVLVACSAVFLDYWEYSRTFHAEPQIWSTTLRGAADAPAQYRIGVLKTAEFLSLHSPLAMRHALALIDFTALLIAAFALRSLLLRSAAWRSASLGTRWFGAAAFVLLLQYSLVWLLWYQRPETLTVAALVALSLWLTTFRLPIPGAVGAVLTAFALVLIGFLLGAVRADAGVAFQLGVAVICLTPLGHGLALTRWLQLLTSLAAAAAAATVQLYIMRVLYPHATYGATPQLQLLLNYADHIRIIPFVLLLAPTIWVTVHIARRRFRPQPAQAALMLGAALFLCLWCALGKIDEVRIFLPFAFAFAPLTVEAFMARISLAENISAPRNVMPTVD